MQAWKKNPRLRFLLDAIPCLHQLKNLTPEDFLLRVICLGIFYLGEGDDSMLFIDPGVFQRCAATCSTHARISLSGGFVMIYRVEWLLQESRLL